MARARKTVRKKEKLSKEETLYRSAVSLMEAVDCVSRFERIVYSLNDAAEKFEKLQGYKDSAERREQCIKYSREAAAKGTEEVYNIAMDKLGRAKNKSGFADAIEEFKRVKKFGYNIEECNKNIQVCKSGIKKCETIAMYKRHGIALCVLLVLIAIFANTPFYPLVKGMYYQSKGEYETAINCYIESGGILIGGRNIKECYYHVAEKFMEKGSYDKALVNYKNAKYKFDAEKKAFDIEKEIIAKSQPGDVVKYGNGEWIILGKTERQALLFSKETGSKRKFDEDGKNIWQGSSLCRWLNKDYINEFTTDEKSVMAGQGMLNANDREIISILDKAQYERYKNIINGTNNAYWLKDSGMGEGSACYVKEDASVGEASSKEDNISVRCSFWVVFK